MKAIPIPIAASAACWGAESAYKSAVNRKRPHINAATHARKSKNKFTASPLQKLEMVTLNGR
jgi:hypothetical protein